MTASGIPRVADGISMIDTCMAGERDLNAVYVVHAREPCLVEAGPGADGPVVLEALDRLGIGPGDLAHLVLTHVHMDHGGGAGALLRAFPRASLWVHERGAPHMADPTRLMTSTARTYGTERMHSLYGRTLPCPTDRIHPVREGDRITLGDRTLRVMHTPGHASHHIALFDEATSSVFTGEAIGTYLPWGPASRPALPPPEVDVEAARRSILSIGALHPATLLTSHFGPTPDPAADLERALRDIASWSQVVEDAIRSRRTVTDDELRERLAHVAADTFAAEAGRSLGAEAARYDVLGSISMNAKGLGRYWRRHLREESPAMPPQES